MSSTPQHRAELLVMMQLRRLTFGHNLLRRRVDRIETAFLVVAITVALLVIPAAAALGTVFALALPLLAWPALFAAFRLARRPLDRYRADEWAREWRKVSPRWTGRQP